MEHSRAGVLGHPIEHSLSPVLHRAAYDALGLEWTYEAYDVTADSLGAFVSTIDATWAGLSLTMPLKVEILPYLHFTEPLAKLVGAVNTVVVDSGGGALSLVGANTDVYGIRAALREAGVEGVGRGVVLGGGATATSAIAACAELGCARPVVAVRERARAAGLMRAAAKMGVDPVFVDLSSDAAIEALRGADAVVSTIPAAAGAQVGAAIDSASGVLLDAVYEPLETPLLQAWLQAGGRGLNGSRMLLHQAAEQVKLMTGRPAPVAQMDRALVANLSRPIR